MTVRWQADGAAERAMHEIEMAHAEHERAHAEGRVSEAEAGRDRARAREGEMAEELEHVKMALSKTAGLKQERDMFRFPPPLSSIFPSLAKTFCLARSGTRLASCHRVRAPCQSPTCRGGPIFGVISVI